jgi:ABC-type enterobactin transport system permease subunit
MRNLLAAVVAVFGLAVAAVSPADARSGTVQIDVTKGAVLLGVQDGNGVLSLGRRRYPLAVSGVGFGASLGFSRAQLTGRVINVRRASDVAGRYTAGTAGFAVVGGAKVVRLTNEKGAVLELTGPQAGLEVALDLSGMQISLR